MKQTRILTTISEEELFRCEFDVKKLNEEMVLGVLKRFGHKFIKWEWRHEITPSTHHALMVTYEVSP